MTNKEFDIYDPAFNFAVRIVKFLDKLPKNTALIEYSRQLIRSSGSIGANIEEADGALSKKNFINKMGLPENKPKNQNIGYV